MKVSKKKCYYVDFVPFTFPDRNYAELDDYLDKNNLERVFVNEVYTD